MLINLFQTIRSTGVPCTLRELLDLLGALENQLVYANIDDFYYLSRAILVKDEKHYDKFDKAFDIYFKGIEKLEDIFQALIPEDWLRKAFENELDPEELKKKKLGYGQNKRSNIHLKMFGDKPFDKVIHQKYLKHENIDNLKGLEVELIYEWEIGSMLIFDRSHLHCSSSVIEGKKIGIATFTKK